jgi:putative transposase
MGAVETAASAMGTAPACAVLGLPRATLYRRRRPTAVTPPASRPAPPRALDPAERQAVLETLHSERFLDQAPAQVQATLLDEGTYLCSPRTMYRLLDAASEVKERRDQVRRPSYAPPELLATRPNEVWSWDITKLRGPAKWTYFYLYVILDILSRYVVGWMLALRESAVLAERLIAETCAKQGIHPGQLTVHADRGAAMTSKPVALLLADLGIVKTHSRPHVSNDNPFSEAQFKTLKYCPAFPERFGSLEDGRAFCHPFFHWYNHEHHHSGLGLLTPAVVHYGLAKGVRAHRQQVLAAAYAAHPERFVKGPPKPADLPQAVWINPPVKKKTAQAAPGMTTGTPVDLQVPPICHLAAASGAPEIDVGATLITRPLVSQCH